jgi:cell division septation protein DedD
VNGRRLSVRDYKGARRGGLALDHGWLRPFAVGVVVGLAIAGALFVAMHRHAAGPGTNTAGSLSAPSAAGHAPSSSLSADQDAPTRAASPGTPTGSHNQADGGASAPASLPTGLAKYDFYQMLPRAQVLIPERESEARLPAGATVERPGVYFLQIGSYKDAATADRVRVQAQKLGVSASVQRIIVDAATWHRVRVGPIRDLALLNRVRHQLQAGNLAAMVVRVNP